jgi:hypothetical protein
MTPDESYACLLIAFLLVVVTQKQFSFWVLDLILKLTRPGATVALLAVLAFTYYKHFHYTFLVLALVIVFLLKDMWSAWPESDARRLNLDVGVDQARFDHASSIDLQMADKTVVHASPSMYAKDFIPKLLVFPPSTGTQLEMNGA